MKQAVVVVTLMGFGCAAPNPKPELESETQAQSSSWTCESLELVSLKSTLPVSGPASELWDLVEHSKDVSCKRRAAFTIGLVGGTKDIQPIQDLVVDWQGEKEVPVWVESLRCNGIDALGLLALRANGQPVASQIVQYLVDSTDPQKWDSRGVEWYVGPYGTAAETHSALAMCAISALPSTQSPVALAHLQSLAAGSTDPSVVSLSNAAIQQYSKIGPGPYSGAAAWPTP